jgi:uncharacterized protein (TIGR02757 family)
MPPQLLDRLDSLYERYNRPCYISPDPLEFVVPYEDPADREVVGLVASSLAFGNVRQIGRSIGAVLDALPSPHRDVMSGTRRTLSNRFAGFRHRYVTDVELVDVLVGARRVLKRHGSFGAVVNAATPDDAASITPGLQALVDALREGSPLERNYLLPSPARGSACKRWHLYLRWMVRDDAVDPGGWPARLQQKLMVPLDTHMHRIAGRLRLTKRKQAGIRTAMEITAAFARLRPEDPVRYDFALTRLGIRTDTDLEAFLRECRVAA